MTARAAILPAGPDTVARAARVLAAGGLVALPTETVYGLAARALDPTAVARIFAAKERPAFDPLIVHLADSADLPRVAQLPPDGDLRRRIDLLTAPHDSGGLWPGPLTLVLPRHPEVPDIVTAGLDTVAVRVPAHPVFRAVLAALGEPLAAPSANPFGFVSPTTAAHVADQLGDRVDLILDGGPCAVGLESTILDLRAPVPRVLRHGAVTLEQLRALLGEVTTGPAVLDRPEAPGQLARHYAPGVPVALLPQHVGAPGGPVGAAWLLVLDGPAPAWATDYARVIAPAQDGDLTRTAVALYGVLREAGAAGVARLDVLACSEEGLGAALLDRVRRAAM
ncbi:MAG: threonylcarbamoyl-AMP synthase [Deltaproteobacteria bacterium]|nr:MAG: threonylcarbamoyl-AMP synthase [Deltaproteobacteria bacterium]